MSEERRNKILKISTELFIHMGFRRTTMGDIAREAGISRPTLYALYKNKEAVFAGVAEQYMLGLQQNLEARVAPSASSATRLKTLIDIALIEPFEKFHGSRVKWELLSMDDPSIQESIEKLDEGHIRLFVSCFEDCEKTKQAFSMSATELGRIVDAACFGMKEKAKDIDDLRAMVNNLLKMLGLEGEGAEQ